MNDATTEIGDCNWRDGVTCQFPELSTTVQDFEGRRYCEAHAPLAAARKNALAVVKLINKCMAAGRVDLSGVTFPGGTVDSTSSYNFPSPKTVCRQCVFGAHIQVVTHGGMFDDSLFQGDTMLVVTGNRSVVSLKRASFGGLLNFQGSEADNAVELSGAVFSGSAQFYSVQNLAHLSFDKTIFEAAPSFKTPKLPQQTTFARARFNRTAQAPDDEGKYRRIRNLFHENRAREWEGVFYAYEKRCHRRSLSWRNSWLARCVSWLYDAAARYGQSFERALTTFVLVQVVFGFSYEIASGRLVIPGPIDMDVVAFTLSQVAKPFELLSARTPSGVAYTAVLAQTDSLGWWSFWTFVHSVVSIGLIALFLLALRWRFRRD